MARSGYLAEMFTFNFKIYNDLNSENEIVLLQIPGSQKNLFVKQHVS